MSKTPWKTLGLTALVAAGVSLATMGGAAAMMLYPQTAQSIDQARQWNSDLQQAYYYKTKHKYRKRHRRQWRYNPRRYGPRYRQYRPGWHLYNGWYYQRPWWSIEVVPAPQPYYNGGNAHVQWCLSKYRSYNPSTDMYKGYDGYYHRCISPY